MSLYNYLVKSSVSAEEIRYNFHREEVEQLYNLLREKGYDAYFDFVKNNQKDILRYIALSDSQRRQKKWTNHPQQLMLRFAALQIAEITVKFQNDILDISNIVDSGSYRSFLATCADGVLPLLVNTPLREFPFEGYDNPFFEYHEETGHPSEQD